MAEALEDNSEGDSDRKNDERSFQKDMFNVFVSEYRENAQPAHSGSSTHSDTCSDRVLKKDLINMKRMVNRAKFVIQGISHPELTADYVSKMDSLIKELDEVMLGQKDSHGEFTVRNVPLPYYDPSDMELLLGQADSNHETRRGNHQLSLFSRAQRSRVSELLGAAEILLTKYNEIRRQMKCAVFE